MPHPGPSPVSTGLGRTLPDSSPAEDRERVLAVRFRSPTVPLLVDELNMEDAGWQEPASTLVSTQAPGQVEALIHPSTIHMGGRHTPEQ